MVDDYIYLDELQCRKESLEEQIKYNNVLIKRLTQRNTEIKYRISALKEEITQFQDENKKGRK